MTSLQLAQRALSFTKLPSDPANISASEAATIVGAINAGMARFYVSAPSGRKTTPISSFLRGSQSVSVGLTQGSYSVTGLTLASDTDRLGDTILVGEYKCRLAIGSSLREPWAQATGTYSGILFDDELYRLPFIAETPVRMDELTLPRNIPAFFSIESLGDAIGGAARAIVRLYPPPTKPSTIRFSASIEAQSFSISNLSNPILVYPSNMDIEAFIIPIIASELALTQYWQDSIPRELAIAKGKETEGFLRTYHEPTGPSMSRAITPVGF